MSGAGAAGAAPFGPVQAGGPLVGWRLDMRRFAPVWDSGEGAFRVGGRWNARGRRMVYACLDPSTAILEVAVHKGFAALDATPHVLSAFEILDPGAVHVARAADLPNPNWLRSGPPSAAQQAFGGELADAHAFVALPSAVSPHAWNVVFDPGRAAGGWRLLFQERFGLDTRLNPPA